MDMDAEKVGIIMTRKRKHKHNQIDYVRTFDIKLDPNKFYIKKLNEGSYAIMYASEEGRIQIATYTDKDKDDDYALNCTVESLEYLTRKI